MALGPKRAGCLVPPCLPSCLSGLRAVTPLSKDSYTLSLSLRAHPAPHGCGSRAKDAPARCAPGGLPSREVARVESGNTELQKGRGGFPPVHRIGMVEGSVAVQELGQRSRRPGQQAAALGPPAARLQVPLERPHARPLAHRLAAPAPRLRGPAGAESRLPAQISARRLFYVSALHVLVALSTHNSLCVPSFVRNLCHSGPRPRPGGWLNVDRVLGEGGRHQGAWHCRAEGHLTPAPHTPLTCQRHQRHRNRLMGPVVAAL